MALISSQSLKGGTNMADSQKVATEDIIEKNENGQNVVVVPAGQPIPDGVDVPKAKTTVETAAVASPAKKSPRKRK